MVEPEDIVWIVASLDGDEPWVVPPFGSDAARLRQSMALLHEHLTDTEFRFRVGRGEQMDGSQVIHFALEAIARAATKP